jgi:hypothetical protein
MAAFPSPSRKPSLREQRLFGLIVAASLGVLGLLARRGLDAGFLASTLWVLGGFFALAYYALPPLRGPMFRAWMTLTFPLAWLVSHLVLGACYYLVLTPIGVILRLCRYDPLQRRFEPSASTYWLRRSERGEPLRYLKQF